MQSESTWRRSLAWTLRILSTWGVVVDSTSTHVAASAPTGLLQPTTVKVSVTFNESVLDAAPRCAAGRCRHRRARPGRGEVRHRDPSTHLDPTGELERGHTYRVEVGGTIHDEAGNPLVATSWTFATAASGVSGFDPARTLSFASGAHTGYQFDVSAARRPRPSLHPGRPASTAATSQRNSVDSAQPGTWLLVDNGVWAGFWIRESNRAYLGRLRGPGHLQPDPLGFVRLRRPDRLPVQRGGGATASKTYTLAARLRRRRLGRGHRQRRHPTS